MIVLVLDSRTDRDLIATACLPSLLLFLTILIHTHVQYYQDLHLRLFNHPSFLTSSLLNDHLLSLYQVHHPLSHLSLLFFLIF